MTLCYWITYYTILAYWITYDLMYISPSLTILQGLLEWTCFHQKNISLVHFFHFGFEFYSDISFYRIQCIPKVVIENCSHYRDRKQGKSWISTLVSQMLISFMCEFKVWRQVFISIQVSVYSAWYNVST